MRNPIFLAALFLLAAPAAAEIVEVQSESEGGAGFGSGELTFLESNQSAYDFDLAVEDEESSQTATQSTQLSASATSLTLSAQGSTNLEVPAQAGNAFSTFSLSFQLTEPASISVSASLNVSAPTSDASTDASFDFDCGCDPAGQDSRRPRGTGPSVCTVPEISIEAETSPELPDSVSASGSGRAGPGTCSLFIFALSTLSEGETTSHTSFNVSLSVTSLPVEEQEDSEEFRWVGGSSGSFADPANWDPEQVPTFVAGDRSDTAVVRNGNQVAIDLAGGASSREPATSSPRGFALSQTTGRLIARIDPLRILSGELILDALSLDERSLVVTNLGGIQLDTGGIRARHATIGEEVRGSLRVQGPEGRFETLGRCSIGAGGVGSFDVFSDGFASTAETRIGDGQREGIAGVHGPNADWLTGNLAVGFESDASLLIENGGTVTSGQAFVDFNLDSGEEARAVVRGAAGGPRGEWTVDQLEIGGRGDLTVGGGGLVHSNGDVVLGNSSFGRARLDVRGGEGARVEVAQRLVVGSNGAADVFVDRPGQIDVDGLLKVSESIGFGSEGSVKVLDFSGQAPTDEQLVSDSAEIGTDSQSLGRLDVGGRMLTSTTAEVGGSFGRGIVTVRGPDSRWRIGQQLTLGSDAAAFDNVLVNLIGGGVIEVASLGGGTLLDIRSSALVTGEGVLRTTGLVQNNGTIDGAITVDGNYAQGVDGVIQNSAAAAAAASSAQVLAASPAGLLRSLAGARRRAPAAPPPTGPVVVTGDAALDGTLVLQFRGGFAPRQGDALAVLDVAGTTTGAFSNLVVQGLAGDPQFDQTSQGGVVTLTAAEDTVALPTVSLKAKPRLKEKKKGGMKLRFKRTGDISQALVVSYAVGGSARNGVDYPTLPGSLEIPAGKKTANVLVRAFDDGLPELSETLELRLLPGDGYSLPLVAEATVEVVDRKKR